MLAAATVDHPHCLQQAPAINPSTVSSLVFYIQHGQKLAATAKVLTFIC